MSYDYDYFVIGAGSGGISSARRAAQYGAKVGIAEDDRLGGTCVNRGCVPKKLMVYASHFSKAYEEAEGYGWGAVSGSFNWSTMITAVNNEVHRLNGIYNNMLDKAGVELFPHRAKLLDAHTLQVGDRSVTADKILIAVGGVPAWPSLPGIEHAISSDDIFHLKQQPKHFVVLGGGYIGCEFACILNGLGSQVTQIIRADKILRGFDDDLRNEIQAAMVKHGIHLINRSEVIAVEKSDDGITVKVKTQAGEAHVLADVLSLAALGRKPNLDNLGLENTQVEVAEGAIAVDQYSRTAEPNIFAVGDCTDQVTL
ncbi:MAG: FAD-dependent oxidoreductase, partial [Cyanobacteria bacterium P01_H01_bin.153]